MRDHESSDTKIAWTDSQSRTAYGGQFQYLLDHRQIAFSHEPATIGRNLCHQPISLFAIPRVFGTTSFTVGDAAIEMQRKSE